MTINFTCGKEKHFLLITALNAAAMPSQRTQRKPIISGQGMGEQAMVVAVLQKKIRLFNNELDASARAARQT